MDKEDLEKLEILEKKMFKAIKISILAVAISLFIGLLSLWVLLNQVTVSVGIDKKLIMLEKRLDKIEGIENKDPLD